MFSRIYYGENTNILNEKEAAQRSFEAASLIKKCTDISGLVKIVIHHPLDAEFIGKHTEQGTPEHLLQVNVA